MDGQAEYEFALNKFDRLSVKRNDPSFWSDNLVQATKDMKNPIAWRNFYSVLGNGEHVYSDEKGIRTLGDWIDDNHGKEIEYNSNIKFIEKRVRNGTVTHIRLTPDISEYIEKEKHGQTLEPMDHIFKTMEEEAPGKITPRLNEISSVRLPQGLEVCSNCSEEDEKIQAE